MTDATFHGDVVPEIGDEGFAAPTSQERKMIEDIGLNDPIELTDEEEQAFSDLLFIGRKEKLIHIAGHTILVCTLTTDVELQLGLLTKEFQGSDGYARAYKVAVVAASIKEIDGRPFYQSLSVEESEDVAYVVRKKFEKVQKYYPILLEMIYTQIVELEKELSPLVDKLKKTLC